MAGIRFIQQLERTKVILDKMGLKMVTPKHGYREKDVIALVPKDQDSLPVFSRDAEVFVGDLHEVDCWLVGVQWARNYDCFLFPDYDKKREKKEETVRHNKLIAILKQDDVKVDK